MKFNDNVRQYGAGIAPTSPGFATYHVLPQMGPLRTIETTVPSVKGHIDLKLQNEEEVFTMELTSPKNTEALFGVPQREGADIISIQVNGTVVWHRGKAMASVEGLEFVEDGEHYHTFKVQPGSWRIEAHY